MMHMVSYTINPKRDISGLIAELQKSVAWCHPLDETWLLVSQEFQAQIWNRLAPYLTQTDRLIVVEITKESNVPSGWMTQEIWDWINGWMASQSGARSTTQTQLWGDTAGPPLLR